MPLNCSNNVLFIVKPPLILKLYRRRFFCECAIYKSTNIVRAKNYNELLQSVPLLAANNVYSKFIRYIRFVFVIFSFSFTTNFVEI